MFSDWSDWSDESDGSNFLVKLFVLHLVLVLIDSTKIVIFLFFLSLLGVLGLVGLVGGSLSWMFSDWSDWSDGSEVLSCIFRYFARGSLPKANRALGGRKREKGVVFSLRRRGGGRGSPYEMPMFTRFSGRNGEVFLTRGGGISFSRAKRYGKTKKGRKRASGSRALPLMGEMEGALPCVVFQFQLEVTAMMLPSMGKRSQPM